MRPASAAATEPIEDLAEAFALDELHDVVELTLILAHAEDGHDIGVMQLGRGTRLAAEPLDRGRRGAVRQQDLQRRAAAQGQLDRLVDDPHAPLADLADDPEARDRRQRSPSGLLAPFPPTTARPCRSGREETASSSRGPGSAEGPGP